MVRSFADGGDAADRVGARGTAVTVPAATAPGLPVSMSVQAAASTSATTDAPAAAISVIVLVSFSAAVVSSVVLSMITTANVFLLTRLMRPRLDLVP